MTAVLSIIPGMLIATPERTETNRDHAPDQRGEPVMQVTEPSHDLRVALDVSVVVRRAAVFELPVGDQLFERRVVRVELVVQLAQRILVDPGVLAGKPRAALLETKRLLCDTTTTVAQRLELDRTVMHRLIDSSPS